MLNNRKNHRAVLILAAVFFALGACQKTQSPPQAKEGEPGINTSLEGYQPPTPLMEAVLSNDLKKAESLIKQGAEINQLIGSFEDTNRGAYSYYSDSLRPPKTALGLAIQQGFSDMAELLIKKGAFPLQHSHGLSPLTLRLSLTNSPETLIKDIGLLLQYGASPNQGAPFGVTPNQNSSFEAMLLHNPSLEAAKLLIQYGGNPYVLTKEWETLYDIAPEGEIQNYFAFLGGRGNDIIQSSNNNELRFDRYPPRKESHPTPIAAVKFEELPPLPPADTNALFMRFSKDMGTLPTNKNGYYSFKEAPPELQSKALGLLEKALKAEDAPYLDYLISSTSLRVDDLPNPSNTLHLLTNSPALFEHVRRNTYYYDVYYDYFSELATSQALQRDARALEHTLRTYRVRAYLGSKEWEQIVFDTNVVALLIGYNSYEEGSWREAQTNVFTRALVSGDTDTVKRFMDTGIFDKNFLYNNDTQPFVYAQPYPDLMKYLMGKGIQTNMWDVEAYPVLQTAAIEGYLPLVKYYIEQKGWSPLTANREGEPLISLASEHPEIVSYLSQRGGMPKNKAILWSFVVGKYNSDSWPYWVDQKDIRKAAELLKPMPQKVVMRYNDAWRPLDLVQFFAERDANSYLELAVSNKLNINIFNQDGHTPLMVAVSRGQDNAATTLIKAGADMKARQKGGKNLVDILKDLPKYDLIFVDDLWLNYYRTTYKAVKALYLQKYPGDAKLFEPKPLVFNPARPFSLESLQAKMIQEASPPSTIFYREDFDELIVSNIFDIYDCRNADLSTFFSSQTINVYDAEQSALHDELFKFLVLRGADIKPIVGYSSNTYLHLAAQSYNNGAIGFMVEQGLKLEALNSEGETPLLSAAKMVNNYDFRGNAMAAVISLLSNGANPNAKDKDGYTAYAYIAGIVKDGVGPENAQEALAALIEKGADTNVSLFSEPRP